MIKPLVYSQWSHSLWGPLGSSMGSKIALELKPVSERWPRSSSCFSVESVLFIRQMNASSSWEPLLPHRLCVYLLVILAHYSPHPGQLVSGSPHGKQEG